MCGITAIKTVLINRNGCITAELLRYQWVQQFCFISDILITEEEGPTQPSAGCQLPGFRSTPQLYMGTAVPVGPGTET